MKKYFSLLLCLLMTLTAFAASAETFTCFCGGETEYETRTSTTCSHCGAQVALYEDGSMEIQAFDEAGYPIRSAYYTEDGEVYYDVTTEYVFDDNGNVINEKSYSDGALIYEGKSAPGYDGNVYLTSEYWPEEDGESFMEYNDHGDMIKSYYVNKEGEMTFFEDVEYVYGEDGTVLERRNYYNGVLVVERLEDENGATVIDYEEDGSKYVRIYDERGDLKTRTDYDAQGEVLVVYEHEYVYEGDDLISASMKENGRLCSYAEYAKTEEDWTYVKLVKEYNDDGSSIVSVYNEKFDLESLMSYDETGKLVNEETIEYVYDDDGNMLQRTQRQNGVVTGEMFFDVADDGWNVLRREIWYLEDGGKSVAEYDETGCPIGETHYDAEGNVVYESDEISVG